MEQPNFFRFEIGSEVPERIGSAPIKLKIRLSENRKIKRVKLNGREHNDIDGEWIVMRNLPRATDISGEVENNSP